MINIGWLLLLVPAFIMGVLVGGLGVEHSLTRNSSNARNALKRAEAYEIYRKAIGK